MADKKTNFFGQVKTQITAGVGVVLATLGTVFSDKVEEFFGVGICKSDFNKSSPKYSSFF